MQHHSLCPQHFEFEISGVKERFILMLGGIRDGCQSCTYEFDNGKKAKHSTYAQKCGRSSSNRSAKKQIIMKNNRLKNIKSKNKKSNLISNKQGFHITSRVTTQKSNSHIHHKKELNIKEGSISHYKSKDIAVTVIPPEIEKLLHITPPHLTDDDSKPTWVSCPNPAGKVQHDDSDFVLSSYSDYQSQHNLNGLSPDRFTNIPFKSMSLYNKTHVSPCSTGSYRVIKLVRDRLAPRPWGFTFSSHEFGGACLVNSLEPFSPATGAVDVGLLIDLSSESQALHVNDMIVCVNGKQVGSMTELDLAVDIDICTSDSILVISKYKGKCTLSAVDSSV